MSTKWGHKCRVTKYSCVLWYLSFQSLQVKQILAFPVLLIFRLGSLLPNWPLRYPFKHTKGAPVFIKTGFRLTMNFEDIWLIMIGSFYDRDICLWGQCGSIEATRNWISTKSRKPQFIWLNWEVDKDISKFPYLLLGLFRSVRQNPKAQLPLITL